MFDLTPEPIRYDVEAWEIRGDETHPGRDPVCARCGQRRSAHAHHRQLRSRGGLDTWANQIGLCGICHGEVHAAVERATFEGWLVESWEDPATVPLDYHGRGRVLLEYSGAINEVAA